MHSPTPEFADRSQILLRKKLELLRSLLALAREEENALAEKQWNRLKRAVEETARRTAEVDGIDKKLSCLVASETRRCGTVPALPCSSETKSLLEEIKATLNLFGQMEGETMRGLKKEREIVQERLSRLRQGRATVNAYAPVKALAARFVNVQS